MAIQKQEFYEGAALHLLVRNAGEVNLRYDHPFFVADERLLIHIKHSTKKRSPWGFTFTPDEQVALEQRSTKLSVWLGLVCGADGVAAVGYDEYRRIAQLRDSSIHVACYRRHRQHYEVSGPDGTIDRKVAPSEWHRLLES